MMLSKVILDVLQVFRGSASTRAGSRLEHSFDAGVHFFFFDELAAVSLLDALSDAGSKACVIFQQPQRRILHQLCRVHAFLRGNSGETCFLSGVNRTSMILQTRRARSLCQAGKEFTSSPAAAPSS